VGNLARQGKSLEEIKKELKMPEYADWAGQGSEHRRSVQVGEEVVINLGLTFASWRLGARKKK
jgi:hypothetical protein